MNLMVVSSTFESIWFKDKETSLAMAIDNAFETLGVVLMFFLQPHIYNASGGLFTGFSIVLICSAIGFAASFVLAYFDQYAPDALGEKPEAVANDEEAYKNFSFATFKQLGSGYWMAALSYMCVAGAITLFGNVISAYFMDRFNMDSESSGYIAGSSPLAMAAATAPIGMLLHKYGYKVHVGNIFLIGINRIVLISTGTAIAAMTVMTLLPDCDQCYYSVPFYFILCISLVSYMTAMYPSFP